MILTVCISHDCKLKNRCYRYYSEFDNDYEKAYEDFSYKNRTEKRCFIDIYKKLEKKSD